MSRQFQAGDTVRVINVEPGLRVPRVPIGTMTTVLYYYPAEGGRRAVIGCNFGVVNHGNYYASQFELVHGADEPYPMAEPDFSLDEISQAEAIVQSLG